MAKFAFWNVQRIGNMNPNTDQPAFRVGYFQAVIKDIITAYRPTFLVLAEVTSLGTSIQQWLDSQAWFSTEYVGEFIPVNSTRNPCNFFVAKKKKNSVVYHGVFGTNVQRPYLALNATSGLTIAFAHLKSGGSVNTEDELQTFADEMAARNVDAICGDLNLNYEKIFTRASDLKRSLAQTGYAAVPPLENGNVIATFGKVGRDGSFVSKTLDFLVCKASHAARVVNTPYRYGEGDFAVIDHAPVLFQIKTP